MATGSTALTKLAGFREQFVIPDGVIYLDGNSLGVLPKAAIAAVRRTVEEEWGQGLIRSWNTADWVNAPRRCGDKIARLIGARGSEIAFVKNTTEGLGFVANGYPWKSGDNVIIADIEYPSNVYCWVRLAKLGVELRWVKNRQGRITVDDIRALMDSRTRIVSLSAVQFSNGYRQDLHGTANLCNERGVLLNLDGIQWVGALAIDVEPDYAPLLDAFPLPAD